MIEFFRTLFAVDFMPHVYCLRLPSLVWLEAISDGTIATAYFIIPFGLVRLVQKRDDLAFNWLFILFAVFILSCGGTHVLGIITLWLPIYRVDALLKVITAVSSILTAILLIRILPKLALLPSPEQWRVANQKLTIEINQRKAAEFSLRAMNTDLESRVDERTRELEEKNAKLHELTTAWDLSHGMIRDLEGTISFWCAGSEQLYGWSKQEAVGMDSHELLKTEFPKPLAEINSEIKEEGSWAGELIHTTKSGSRRNVATHWILQRSTSGDRGSIIEVNNDITDRLRADEALLRLADLVESSSDAIISTTPDGIVTSWNGAAESLFGYPAAEMLGRGIERLTPGSRLADERAMLVQVGKGVGSKRFETLRVTSSGRQIDVSLTISSIRNPAGKVVGISQIIHDISESKAHEEAIRLSEERQRLAVEAGQVGLWYMDVNNGQSIWTERCKLLHGLAPNSTVPDFPFTLDLLNEEDRPAMAEAFTKTMKGEGAIALEYRTSGLGSRARWLQIKGQAQRDAQGAVKAIYGTVIDLTERRETENKLRRANTELEQFAYAAAHDLQEPLRNVALAAELLKVEQNSQALSDAQDADSSMLTTVIENARRMEAMVKDLLAYSRALDASESQETRADGEAVLKKVLQNLASSIAEKAASVTNDRLPAVWMQETHLLQILQNLIGNALKYSGESPVTIHIGAVVRKSDALMFVRDNGVGIAPQFHDRAFGMFKRLHQGAAKGTGIGLAVCKRIVEHYGGRIWIESEAGKGATLFFTVPSTNHE